MNTVPDLATLDDLLEHAGWTRALAVRLLGDADEAEDVVQETWLSALRVPPNRRRALRPWIATVVRNLVRSQSRRRKRARLREQRLAGEQTVPSSEELLSQLETERALAALVLDLPEPYRHTILLRYHHGKSAADIARAEQIPEGTVRWRLKYGLDDLRRRFEERSGGADAARSILVPFAAAASAVALGKAALAAPAVVLSGKAVVAAAAAVAIATVGTTAAIRRPEPARPKVVAQAARPARSTPARAPTASPPARVPTAPSATATITAPAVFTVAPPPAGSGAGSAPPAQVDIEIQAGRRGHAVRWKTRAPTPLVITVSPVPTEPANVTQAPRESPVPSRWCCRRALVVGDYVEGRACLRVPFDSPGNECQPYGLEREVHCVDDTYGQFASGDLKRTGRLVCEGAAL